MNTSFSPLVRHTSGRPLRLGGGLALVLTALCGPLAVPMARAAAPSPAMTAARALIAAHSYRMIDTSYIGVTTLVLVRHDSAVRLDTKTTASGVTTEYVDTGQHTCMRIATSPWTCTSDSHAKDYNDLSIVVGPLGGNPVEGGAHYTAAGMQMRQGQACQRYTYMGTTNTGSTRVTGKLTLWLAAATQRPVELDDQSSLTGFSTTIWSNWNDPHLTTPAVPAS